MSIMNSKNAKKMRKIIGEHPLSGPQKRLYMRCKKAYDKLPSAYRPTFLVAMDQSINGEKKV